MGYSAMWNRMHQFQVRSLVTVWVTQIMYVCAMLRWLTTAHSKEPWRRQSLRGKTFKRAMMTAPLGVKIEVSRTQQLDLSITQNENIYLFWGLVHGSFPSQQPLPSCQVLHTRLEMLHGDTGVEKLDLYIVPCMYMCKQPYIHAFRKLNVLKVVV